jgi:hypothetical protein
MRRNAVSSDSRKYLYLQAFRGISEKVVAGGRYELYSNYPLEIQAVAASVTARPKMDGEGPDLSGHVSLCRAIEGTGSLPQRVGVRASTSKEIDLQDD